MEREKKISKEEYLTVTSSKVAFSFFSFFVVFLTVGKGFIGLAVLCVFVGFLINIKNK